jgi:hypothetical protein
MDYIDLNLHEDSDINSNIISNQLHLFFQEIELAIQIRPNEIFGVKESINLSRYLFNRYVSITQIRNEIINFINKHCQHATLFKFTASVETIKGSLKNDMLYIVVKVFDVDQFGEEREFFQKFLLGSANQ